MYNDITREGARHFTAISEADDAEGSGGNVGVVGTDQILENRSVIPQLTEDQMVSVGNGPASDVAAQTRDREHEQQFLGN